MSRFVATILLLSDCNYCTHNCFLKRRFEIKTTEISKVIKSLREREKCYVTISVSFQNGSISGWAWCLMPQSSGWWASRSHLSRAMTAGGRGPSTVPSLSRTLSHRVQWSHAIKCWIWGIDAVMLCSQWINQIIFRYNCFCLKEKNQVIVEHGPISESNKIDFETCSF